MNRREERRADRLVAAQVRREDAAAAAQVRIAEHAAIARERRADEHARDEARRDNAQTRRDNRAAALSAVQAWAGERVVELLVYPIALLSFVLAAPAMAAWGRDVYGSALGVLLPGITELGMWAFAVAVLVARHRTPGRPVGWLQVGVWTFAAVAFTTNALHGLAARWEYGAVMGVVSVAGVVAHQLSLANPPRSRTERAATRIERAAARKVARVRRVAVRQAVAELDTDGRARLVFVPGRYVLDRPRPWARRRLNTAIVPGLPVTGGASDWDRELADLLATSGTATPGQPPTLDPNQASGSDGGVATLDPGADLRGSTPDPGRVDRKPGRSIDQLRAELSAAIEAGRVDPTSAQSIRKVLRCKADRARQLRDEHLQEGDTQ